MEKSTKVKQYKLDRVASLEEEIRKAENFIFVDYRGLTVEQITELRGELRKVHAKLQVIKNSAARVAFRQTQQTGTEDFLFGPTALTYCYEEPGPVAKAIFASAKNTTLHVKGALLGSEVLDSASLESLSKLPGRTELIQMLMGTMKAPVSNFVYALNGVTSKLVRTLAAVCEKQAQENE